MQWRVVVESSGTEGVVRVHEVHFGDNSHNVGSSPVKLGLTLGEAKGVLSSLQRHLVQMQTEEYCQARRRCPRCGAQRPLKDRRARQLRSLFGVIEVRAPRFAPCRCSVTLRATLNPVTEIMPDRCTAEFERVLAKLGSLLPYRRALDLLDDFFPVEKPPKVETVRQHTLRVGATLERAPRSAASAADAIAVSIDAGHVRAIPSYRGAFFRDLCRAGQQ